MYIFPTTNGAGIDHVIRHPHHEPNRLVPWCIPPASGNKCVTETLGSTSDTQPARPGICVRLVFHERMRVSNYDGAQTKKRPRSSSLKHPPPPHPSQKLYLFHGYLFHGYLFVHTFFMDAFFMDTFFMDTFFVDSFSVDTFFMDTFFVYAFFMDAFFMDTFSWIPFSWIPFSWIPFSWIPSSGLKKGIWFLPIPSTNALKLTTNTSRSILLRQFLAMDKLFSIYIYFNSSTNNSE